MPSKKLLAATSAVIAIATPVAGYAAAERTAAPAPARVVIADFAFKPKTKVVKPRQLVTWTNRDRSIHTVASTKRVAGRPVFETAAGGPGAVLKARAPRKKGRYAYFCEVHPRMKGTLLVG